MTTAVAAARATRPEQPKTAPHVVGFVFHLELKRIELGLGVVEFAQRLEVSRGDYYLMRQAKTRPTWALMYRVLDLWPGEFDAEVPEVIRRWGRT